MSTRGRQSSGPRSSPIAGEGRTEAVVPVVPPLDHVKDEEDLRWEYSVSVASRDSNQQWQTVDFSDMRPSRCWGDMFWSNGDSYRCQRDSATDVGLCAGHYRDIIGGEHGN